MGEILVVGSMAFDTIESPAGKVARTLGGSANYFSIAASNFVPVKLVGVVGRDFPEDHMSFLKSRGVDIEGLQVVDGKTFHWKGDYLEDLNEAKTHVTELNVFETFKPELPEPYKSVPYLFLANIDPDLQLHVLDSIDEGAVIACDTMNLWLNIKKETVREVVKRSHIVFINEKEVQQLTGHSNVFKAMDSIHDLGVPVCVVKRGEYGSILGTSDGVAILPAYPLRNVVDPTGAGDSFAGGFMATLAAANGRNDIADLKRSLMWGTVVASIGVEDFGLGAFLKTDKEGIQKRFNEFSNMVSFG